MEIDADFPVALLPSLAVEGVFDAYIAEAMPTDKGRRHAKRWLADHRPLRDVCEFRRAAARAYASLAPCSVVAAGVRVHEWEGFRDVLGADRGSVTLVVGARGPMGKSTAARFLKAEMSREIDRMHGRAPDAPPRDDHVVQWIADGARFPSDILRVAQLARSPPPWSMRLDGVVLGMPWGGDDQAQGAERFRQTARAIRAARVHAALVLDPWRAYDPLPLSEEADRIVVVTGPSVSAHAATAEVAAPLVSMDREKLVSLFGRLPPFTALVFDRAPGWRVGRLAFDQATTRISAVGNLMGQGAWPAIEPDALQ